MLQLRTLAGLMLLAAVAGCSQRSTAEDWFKVENPTAQQSLVAEMQKRGIPSRVDEENRVWFPAEQRTAVHEIAFGLMDSAEPDRETFAFTEPEYTDMLISRLRAANVPFGTEMKDGVTYVVLDSSNKPLWSPIRQEVETLFAAEKRRQLYGVQE